MTALYKLLSLTKSEVETPHQQMQREVKQICLKFKINHPLLGEDLFNAKLFNYHKQLRPFGFKI